MLIDVLIGELDFKENRKSGGNTQVIPQTGCRMDNDEHEYREQLAGTGTHISTIRKWPI
jgi:hypothetical protein